MPPGRADEAYEAAGWACEASRYGLGGVCAGRAVIHHRRPRGQGGTSDPTIHDLDNLAVLCDSHHLLVHDRPSESYANGLLIRRAGLPINRKTDQ